MPCIFPMIPLTVSLFTKQSKSRSEGIAKALTYGLSIVVIFVALACFATLIFGASALNEFSTNPWVNIAFFVVFVFFAISFFGAFEIALPASWANYTDKQADKGGYIGIFFMAFTLVIISFSCTLPIIGSLATQASTTGNYYALIVGSLGFSVTLAIPFVLFAIFPSWINSLPRSGGWMNTVKVSLGFIELAFAFKFLSNADLVWQAHMLEREVFLAIWIAIFGLMGLYLLGKFRLPHDSPEDRIGIPRLFFSILTFTFVMYMIPDRKSTRLNSSHVKISYAVFCLNTPTSSEIYSLSLHDALPIFWQAHMLEREVFLAIWIAIFGLMGLYLLGKFRLPHDSPEDRIGIPRLFFSILTFTFVMYMI